MSTWHASPLTTSRRGTPFVLGLALLATGAATLGAIALPGGIYLNPDATPLGTLVWLALGSLLVVRGFRWAWWLAAWIATVSLVFPLMVALSGDPAALVAAPPAAAALWLLDGPIASSLAARRHGPRPSRKGLAIVALLAVVLCLPLLGDLTLAYA